MIFRASDNGISYFEYKVINELMHSHIEEFGADLRAIIAFGPLVTGQETFDIELLEVVSEWQGPARMSYGSTSSLPTRGKLLLHFLPAKEFENPLSSDTQDLTESLRDGYKIIYEVPPGYARHILMRAFGEHEPSTDGGRFADPRRPLAR